MPLAPESEQRGFWPWAGLSAPTASRRSERNENRVAEQLRGLSLISSCLRTETPCSQTNHPARHLPQGFPTTQRSGA